MIGCSKSTSKNMSKICFINQPAGLGDILFCQKIARRAITDFNCETVYWAVSNTYNYISNYVHNEGVVFQELSKQQQLGSEIINNDNFLYIPLESSDRVINHTNPWAHGHIKYKFFYDTDYSDWKNYFTITRNLEKENELIQKLKLENGESFNLINKNFGTYPHFVKTNLINPKNNLKNVYMDFIDGFNIFDWIGVILKAQEIHTVETSLYYILEKLNIVDNVFIYSKYKSQYGINDDYSYMKSHCSPKWNYF